MMRQARAGSNSILYAAEYFVCPRCEISTTTRNRQRLDRRKLSSIHIRSTESVIPQTHYDFFPKSLANGPPPRGPFDVDLKRLRNEFLQLQATAHPDRHSQEMKTRAEALSSRINEAYETLRDPLLRTQYLLSLRGIDTAEDETAKVDDQGLLMDVLEAQEKIESATAESDLEELAETNRQRVRESVRAIGEAFGKDDLETAKREVARLRYWTNITQGIHEFTPGKPITLVH